MKTSHSQNFSILLIDLHQVEAFMYSIVLNLIYLKQFLMTQPKHLLGGGLFMIKMVISNNLFSTKLLFMKILQRLRKGMKFLEIMKEKLSVYQILFESHLM